MYLHELFSKRHTDYDLRHSFRKLNLPKPHTNYLKRSFSYSGALLWNSLPESIRAIRSIGQFKVAEYSFLAYRCYKTLFGNYVLLDAQNWHGVRLTKKEYILVRLVELGTVSMATQ